MVECTIKLEAWTLRDDHARDVGLSMDLPLPDDWPDPKHEGRYTVGRQVWQQWKWQKTYDFIPHILHNLTTAIDIPESTYRWRLRVTINNIIKADQEVMKGDRILVTYIPGEQPQPEKAIVRITMGGYKTFEKECELLPRGEKEFVVEPPIPQKGKKGQKVSISVKDKLTGLPVRASVLINKQKVAETDENGNATFQL